MSRRGDAAGEPSSLRRNPVQGVWALKGQPNPEPAVAVGLDLTYWILGVYLHAYSFAKGSCTCAKTVQPSGGAGARGTSAAGSWTRGLPTSSSVALQLHVGVT